MKYNNITIICYIFYLDKTNNQYFMRKGRKKDKNIVIDFK